MSEFVINDHLLSAECRTLAADIIADFRSENPGADLADLTDEMSDRVHETADGHEWTIYTYKAIMLCAHCDTSEGEAFLEDIGMPETPTFGGLASIIVYGEIRARTEAFIREILEEEESASDSEVAS